MVHRSSAGGGSARGKLSGGVTKKSRAKKSHDDVYDLTKIKTSIPKHLDEDIDDDIAFNSEDEAMYGEFFRGNAKQAKKDARSKGKKGKGSDDDDDGGINEQFDKLHGTDDLFPEDFSDDSRDEFDISEMLDSKDERQKKRKQRREARQKGPRQQVTNEEESMFSTSARNKKSTTAVSFDELVAAADTPASKRIQEATANKKTLLTRDVPEHVKEKMGREQTRELVASDLKKYASVLREMKQSRVQTFPLRAPGHSAVPTTLGGVASAAQETALAAPSTMQSKMNDLLLRSGLTKAAAAAVDASVEGDLPESKKSFLGFSGNDDFHNEETSKAGGDAPTHSYMAKLKAMLTYEVAKRRRFNRIKSKTYRRILRKEKEKEKDRREKAFELLNPEAARKKLQERMEKMRAEERTTQRHKNTSKWVKHVKGIAKFDESTKEAIDEQHRKHQQLMAKMDADAGEELMNAVEEESESEEEDRRVDELLSAAPNSSALWNTVAAGAGAGEEEGAGSGPLAKARNELNAMGFMKRAKERHGEQLSAELRDLQEDIARYQKGLEPVHHAGGGKARGKKQRGNIGADSDDDDEVRRARGEAAADDDEEIDGATAGHSLLKRRRPPTNDSAAAAPQRSGADGAGRRQFTKAAKGSKALEPTLPQSKGLLATERRADVEGHSDGGAQAADDWGDEGVEGEGGIDRDAADDASAPSSSLLPEKRVRKESRATTTAEGFSTASIIPLKAEHGGRRVGPTKKILMPRSSVAAAAARKAELDAAEPAASDALVVSEEDRKALQQEALIARAFARDDIDDDFLKQKEHQVEAIMKPVDKNATLPGWGEWGGEDERLNKRHNAKVEKMDLARKLERSTLLAARADAKLDHVIINHDVDLVASKQQLKMVPRPFSNAQEFSRSMRQPMGPEWNTATTLRTGTQPKIVAKQGLIIDPLDLSTHGKKKPKTTRRKSTGASA